MKFNRFLIQLFALLFLFGVVGCDFQEKSENDRVQDNSTEILYTSDTELKRLFEEKISDHQVTLKGTIKDVLSDDLEGAKHQRFILELKSSQTVLVAHNIDLAPRISGLKHGEMIEVSGEYEWNPKGGVVHWTHDDPYGVHAAGWIEYQGRRSQ
jgi:hypothetical protein